MTIRLGFGDVNKFLGITEQFDCSFDLVQRNNHVDGKSLVGILSLDLDNPIIVCVVTDNNRDIEKFKELLKLSCIYVED